MHLPWLALVLGILLYAPYFLQALISYMEAGYLAFFIFSLYNSLAFTLILAGLVIACSMLYFRRAGDVTVREGLLLGVVWLAVMFFFDAGLLLISGGEPDFGRLTMFRFVHHLLIPAITGIYAFLRNRRLSGELSR